MKRCPIIAALALLPLQTITTQAAPEIEKPGPLANNTIRLHSGWDISPAGTNSEKMGDLLMGGAISPNGKWLAFVNGGAADHAVHLADTLTGKVVISVPVERAQSSSGVAFSLDGARLYVSGANAGQIYVFGVGDDGALTVQAPLVLPQLQSVVVRKADPGADAGRDPLLQDAPEGKAYLSGLAVSPDGATIYVANLASNTVYTLDSKTGAQKMQRELEPLDRPGAVSVSPDGQTLYVALWGAAKIEVLDAATLETRTVYRVGSHPNSLLLSRDGSRLFTSCGNDDSVYSIDTATSAVQEKINMRLTPRAPAGSTPSALALSPDQKTLYVANSDNNDVAVVDVEVPGRSRIEGFIPTTWYPTLVAASPDGKRIFIGSGKGLGTGPNDRKRPIDPVKPAGAPYIINLLSGILSTVDIPDAARLTTYTRQVYANSPYTDALLDAPAHAPKAGTSPIPSSPKGTSPIKHILYIIKENRTYDQVLGDLKDDKGHPLGNGDPALTFFDEKVTPNHHALAREFVTLDNLYVNGEVSVDGHHWSNGAYVPDSMQRTWPSSYGGKGAPPITYGDSDDPLSETPNGRIWDLCERAGLSFRTYYRGVSKRKSEEWAAAKGKRDYQRSDIYLQDVAKWEKNGDMPSLTVMWLGEDHTRGTTPGAFTPRAAVASNDQGIGKIVAGCSKSRFWKDMAIFIIEDDAQNGPDHVDAHRTVALVASPYTRRHVVDSTFYSTCSLLRTMELILGLPPMSQYDAAATPLYNSFTNKPDFSAYTDKPAQIDLNTKNSPRALGAKASIKLDFSGPDHLTVQDEDTLNRVLWHDAKGENAPYPGIVHRPIFDLNGRPVTASAHRVKHDDDDD